MNYEILNHTKALFREIVDFYVNWNDEPTLILPDLLNYPSTNRLIKERQRTRDQQLQDGKSVLIDPYKISGKDVTWYLCFERVIPLQDEQFTLTIDELGAINTEAEERSRTQWCVDFQNLLNALLIQLQVADNRPLLLSDEITSWATIDQTLRSLADTHVRPLISQYLSLVKRYQYITSTNPASPVGNRKIPTIYILSAAKQGLIGDLIPYVDASQYNNLRDLINEGKVPDKPIICNCEQVRLGEIFYERVKAQHKKDWKIQTYKSVIAKWICRHFVRSEFGTVKKLSESTVLNHLSDKGLSKS